MAASVNNNNMEIDVHISDILREVITFLECLRDVKLPLKLESLREELLTHAKNTLSVTRTSSPDRPYLDMNSGAKSLLLIKNETDSEDYVGMEGSQKQPHQNYDYDYETCENQNKITLPSIMLPKSPERHIDHVDVGEETNEQLLGIYKNLSAAQSKSKCHKCGPLYKKEGKKLFLSENRACWIALIGSHLLIYRSERHNRPYGIHPIRGYKARVPNLIPRDRHKREATFEIYKPGNETLQFVARTPKEMEQWIAKVHEVGCSTKNVISDVGIREEQRITNESSPWMIHRGNNKKTRHQNTVEKPIATNKPVELSVDYRKDEKKKQGMDTVEDPPPLPSRIPRRLPSLPPDSAIASYRVAVEDDDDDDEIYHKIEDLINGTCYQNLALRRRRVIDEQQDTVSYDDIHGPDKKNGATREQVAKSDDTTSHEETYDDIGTLSRANGSIARTEHQDNRDGSSPEKEKQEFYDDVENLISNGKFAKDRAKDQIDTLGKSVQKKSFLGRVLSRKESSGKLPNKKYKKKTQGSSSNPSPSSIVAEEMPTYDDVSNLTTNQESMANNEDLPEYNCPPPPRPVHITRSPIINNPDNQIEEIYDDVNTCREEYNKQQTVLESTRESRATETRNDAAMYNMDPGVNNDLSNEEIEHYQSPRSDLRICEIQSTAEIRQTEEELYDDVALLTDFKARQRIVVNEQRDNEDSRSSIPDKKSRNRFGVNRRSRTSDASGICEEQTNRRSNNDCEEVEDALDKKNTFKKLISKMENSLARVSTRNSTSHLTAKSSATSHNF